MTVDVALVGGGLANGLIAWRLSHERPDLSLRLIERGDSLGGNHTWSFHETDVSPGAQAWLEPLLSASWHGYDVAFPGFRRAFGGRYLSIRSADFHERLTTRLGDRVMLRRAVGQVTGTTVAFDDGSDPLEARCVVDGRGWRPHARAVYGYQRFLGQDLQLARPHGLVRPILMDATVDQRGGYRFVYVLPWSQRSLLVEDTVYGDGPEHDDAGSRTTIAEFAAARGWDIVAVEREERGVLPIPLVVPSRSFDLDEGAVQVGTRAGLFHATTGYSLPYAARVADALASVRSLSTGSAQVALRPIRTGLRRRQWLFRFLNRMLFWAGGPSTRFKVLERFHRLPEGTVARFYADQLTFRDVARLFTGAPPVPIGAALRCLVERPRI